MSKSFLDELFDTADTAMGAIEGALAPANATTAFQKQSVIDIRDDWEDNVHGEEVVKLSNRISTLEDALREACDGLEALPYPGAELSEKLRKLL